VASVDDRLTPLLGSLASHTIQEQRQDQFEIRDSGEVWYGAAAAAAAQQLIQPLPAMVRR
jgi:hypothetical protein